MSFPYIYVSKILLCTKGEKLGVNKVIARLEGPLRSMCKPLWLMFLQLFSWERHQAKWFTHTSWRNILSCKYFRDWSKNQNFGNQKKSWIWNFQSIHFSYDLLTTDLWIPWREFLRKIPVTKMPLVKKLHK